MEGSLRMKSNRYQVTFPPHSVSATLNTFNVGVMLGAYHFAVVPPWMPLAVPLTLIPFCTFFAVLDWSRTILYLRGSPKYASL